MQSGTWSRPMTSESPKAVGEIIPADLPADSESQPGGINQEPDRQEDSPRLIGPLAEDPSNRLIYLDEDVMRVISMRLVNDPRLFVKLRERSGNDHVQLGVINDAGAVGAVYFAQRIWHLPVSETLIDIPSLNGEAASTDPYPGAVVRVKAFLRAKGDLLPGRLTLTAFGNLRIRVELAHRGTLSSNSAFLSGRALFVVGELRRLNPLSVAAAAVHLANGVY
jgi:hypothetical protein